MNATVKQGQTYASGTWWTFEIKDDAGSKLAWGEARSEAKAMAECARCMLGWAVTSAVKHDGIEGATKLQRDYLRLVEVGR
jgi:hypothetical protein